LAPFAARHIVPEATMRLSLCKPHRIGALTVADCRKRGVELLRIAAVELRIARPAAQQAADEPIRARRRFVLAPEHEATLLVFRDAGSPATEALLAPNEFFILAVGTGA
jgi:hypothetical protein